MLSQRERELVHLALDGAASPEAARELRALVAGSPEARGYLAALTNQSRRLAELPRVPAPPGLFDAVMAGVGPPVFGVPIVVTRTPIIPRVPRVRRRSALGPGLLAASLAAAAGVGLFALSQPPKKELAVAPKAADTGFDPRVPHAHPTPPPPPQPAPPAPPKVEVVEVAPAPRRVGPPPVVEGGVSFAARPTFLALAPRAPLLVPVGELGGDEVAARIRALAETEPVLRADLFVADPAAALRAAHAALDACGVAAFTPEALGESANARAGWALYSETLTADDRARLFAALGDAGAGGSLHLFAASHVDARDFRELTGIDRGFWKRPRPAGSETAEQVATALRQRHKSALVVSTAPGARLGTEAKAFWNKAGPAPAGALLLVCRGL